MSCAPGEPDCARESATAAAADRDESELGGGWVRCRAGTAGESGGGEEDGEDEEGVRCRVRAASPK